MPHVFYADESGTSPPCPFYSIGVVCIEESALVAFEERFNDLVREHQVRGEVHWTEVRKSYGLMNTILDLLRMGLKGHFRFSCIVVEKSKYNNWNRGDRETAFYKTYTFILSKCGAFADGGAKVFIHQRSDEYPHREETVEIIANRMLMKMRKPSEIRSVNKVPAIGCPGIQAADVLTGAFNAAHHLHHMPECALHDGKKLLLTRMAQSLGWRSLYADTFPNPPFNVWHFPIESRGPTRKVVAKLNVPNISASDIELLGS